MKKSKFKTLLLVKAAFVFFMSCCNDTKLVVMSDIESNIDTVQKYHLKYQSSIYFENDTNDNYWPMFNFNYSGVNNDVYCMSSQWNILVYNFEQAKIQKIKLPAQVKETLFKDKVFMKLIRKNDSTYIIIAGNKFVEFNIKSQNVSIKDIKLPLYPDTRYYISNKDVERFGYPVIIDSFNSILMSSYLIDRKTKRWTKSIEPYPLEMVINANNLNTNYRTFQLPTFFKLFDYGSFEICYRVLNGKNRIFTFPLSGNIYLENSNGELQSFGGKSKFQWDTIVSPLSYNNERITISSDSNWYHYTHNDYYGYMVYNPQVKKYFRFYHHKLPKKLENGYYATAENKKVSIQVFSENFELIHEEILDGIYFTYYLIPYKKGFIINKNGHRWKSKTHEFLYYELVKE